MIGKLHNHFSFIILLIGFIIEEDCKKEGFFMNDELLNFITKSPSVFHVIDNMKKVLDENGFIELYESYQWDLQEGHSYYVTRNNSSIIAFKLPKGFKGINIVASHSDSPTFKLKENNKIVVEDKYVKLNVEGYGGMIMSSWFDRPLSVAGRMIVKENDEFISKLVNVDKDLLMIPNVAIHMNRDVNTGYKYNAQVDLLPLYSLNKDDDIMETICSFNNINKDDVVGHDLYLYNRTPGCIWGSNDEFISSGKLDDLQCAYTSLQSLINSNGSNASMMCVFDNEEVGSGTKQGAAGTMLSDTINRISESIFDNKEAMYRMISNSFMVSSDNAHAIHPNHPELADPTNRPYLNEGIVIKYHAGAKYTTDAISKAIFSDICKRVGIPTQSFTNRSDKLGGSTLGNIANSQISLNTVDIGLSQLAMHSSYETAGSKDSEYLCSALTAFYNTTITQINDLTYKIDIG